MENFEKGDIIQITATGDRWYPCVLVVDKVKAWGVVGYIIVPHGNGETYMLPYRIEYGNFEKVGKVVLFGDVVG